MVIFFRRHSQGKGCEILHMQFFIPKSPGIVPPLLQLYVNLIFSISNAFDTLNVTNYLISTFHKISLQTVS